MRKSKMKKQIEGLSVPLLKISISNAKKRIQSDIHAYNYQVKQGKKELKRSTKYSVMALELAKEELTKRRKKK